MAILPPPGRMTCRAAAAVRWRASAPLRSDLRVAANNNSRTDRLRWPRKTRRKPVVIRRGAPPQTPPEPRPPSHVRRVSRDDRVDRRRVRAGVFVSHVRGRGVRHSHGIDVAVAARAAQGRGVHASAAIGSARRPAARIPRTLAPRRMPTRRREDAEVVGGMCPMCRFPMPFTSDLPEPCATRWRRWPTSTRSTRSAAIRAIAFW